MAILSEVRFGLLLVPFVDVDIGCVGETLILKSPRGYKSAEEEGSVSASLVSPVIVVTWIPLN